MAVVERIVVGAHPRAAPPRALVVAAYAVIYVVWGSTFLAMRYAVETLPPFLMIGVRFLLAGAVLFLWGRWRSGARVTASHWRAATVVGATLILAGTASTAWAEQWVPSGVASLLAATSPLWFVVLEWVGPHRLRPTPGSVCGVVLGLGGVALLVGPTLTTEPGELRTWGAGAAAIIAGSALWAAGSIYSSRAALPRSAPLAIGMQMLAGGALCTIAGALLGEGGRLAATQVSTTSLLALAYLIVFGALLGFTAYLWLLTVSRPSHVATHAYVNPAVAVLLGWAIAHEPITPRTLAAAAIIAGSVALITSSTPSGSDEGAPVEREARS